jgi:hypothetical protein
MTENGLTKYESTEPSAPLPGWSAGTLFVRGTIIELCGFAMKAPLVVAAAGHHDVWTGGVLRYRHCRSADWCSDVHTWFSERKG